MRKTDFKGLYVLGFICLMMVIFPQFSQASLIDDLTTALHDGKATLQLRLGFEYANRDDATSPGRAFNLRTRVGYRTADFYNTQGYVQLQNVSNFVEDFRFKKDGAFHGDLDRDVIADPDGSRVQQAYLDYKGVPATALRLGRQEITLDDHRLIGNVDWRQNGQSFDAAGVTNTAIKNLILYAAYINQVNTITLEDVDLDSLILLHASYSLCQDHTLTLFTYLLDTEDETSAARDSATYGLRFTGHYDRFNYAVDYAHQGDYQDGEGHNGDMFNVFVGAKVSLVDVGAGYSYISGQDGDDRPFDTLFSTAHKFNGWADQFLATNGGTLRDGLQDCYAQVGTKLWGTKFLAIYHYFDTTEDQAFDSSYGDEIDLLVARKLGTNLSGLLKYANYSEDDSSANGFANPTTDTEIFWARLNYAF